MVETSPIFTPIYYPPQDVPKSWTGGAALYRFDLCKLNVLWLIHPLVDRVWGECWGGDQISDLVHNEFTAEMRDGTRAQPWHFFQQWHRVLVEGWGLDYRVIADRALEAQLRTFPGSMPTAQVFPFRRRD